jgi:DNA-binding NarL/FixJ family response regulator
VKVIRLLIADDHSIVRDGLKQLFQQCEDIEVVAEASDGEQVLNALQIDAFDLLLLDMSMQGVSGLELISRIRSLHPKQRILILTMHTEPNIASRALKSGAQGYLSKDCDTATLLSAIRKVTAGERFLDPILGVQMAFDVDNNSDATPEMKLSDREYSVMQMLLQGMGVNEIARELSISNKTVSTHKIRLMRKLGVDSNADLVRYALKHGLE